MVLIGQGDISLEDFHRVAKGEKVEIDPEVFIRIRRSREELESLLKSGKVIYGLNTGFGKLANTKISKDKLKQLQVNLVRSHAVGSGNFTKLEIVRGMMFLRAFVLSRGYSGVRPEVVQRLLDFLNLDIVPYVPVYGSVGACGDLAPLSHIALAMIGEGDVFLRRTLYPSLIAHRMVGLEPLELYEKEGLALINGLQYSLSTLAYTLYETQTLLKQAITIFLLALWSVGCCSEPYLPELAKLKPSEGFRKVLAYIEPHISSFKPYREGIQDPYSLRVSPQVYGAVWDNLDYISRIVHTEMNSINDNPIILNGNVVSSGMFHGEALAFAGDILNMSLCEIASISERRSYYLNSLLNFLTKDPGLNSGYMIAHVSQASIVSLMKSTCSPSSVDNIPTSAGQEDFVPMSANATIKAFENLERAYHVLSWELLMVLQALHITERYKLLPKRLREIYEHLRTKKNQAIPPLEQDRYMKRDFERAMKFLKEGELVC